MKRMLVLLMAIFILPTLIVLGDPDCPAIVQQALTTASDACNGVGRNQACYGYLKVTAQPQPGIAQFNFTRPGDTARVDDIQSLRLSPMNLEQSSWGIALMHLQASLPTSSSGNITLLTFGDVSLTNGVQPTTALSITTTSPVNVRQFPTTNAAVITSLAGDQTVSADERLADSSWLRVDLPDSSEPGWINTSFVQPSGNLDNLTVGDGQDTAFRPMQAFYFQSGNDSSPCAQVPASGLMIQTPEGSGEVRLWINEVRVDFGSTVYFQAQANGMMTVTTVEGHARVEAMGIASTAVAGTSVQVPLDANLKPTAPPSAPQSYNAAALQNLPLSLLQRPISIHPGLTPQELLATQQPIPDVATNGNVAVNAPGKNGNSDTTTSSNTTVSSNSSQSGSQSGGDSGSGNSSDTGGKNCPGNSCHDQCPGNSCHDGNGNGNSGKNCPGNSCHSQEVGTIASNNIGATVSSVGNMVSNTLCSVKIPLLGNPLCRG